MRWFHRERPYDIVLEAVHRGPDGRVLWARGYERIFVHYSDRRIFPREALVRALEAGKRLAAGRRKPYWGNTFDVYADVRLARRGDGAWMVLSTRPEARAELDGLPLL